MTAFGMAFPKTGQAASASLARSKAWGRRMRESLLLPEADV
jgi:hypothetical protein